MSAEPDRGWRVAQARAQARDLEDAGRILEWLRRRETPDSVAAMLEGLAENGRQLSAWRMRALLRYLVARQQVERVGSESRGPYVRGRPAALYRASKAVAT